MQSPKLMAETGQITLRDGPARLLALGDLELDPSGPFYSFMLTFLAASAGLTAVYDAANYPMFMHGTAGIFPSKALGAKISLADCVASVRAGALPQQEAEIRLCGMLANSAFESLGAAAKEKLRADLAGEMFRHIRNAASHGNKWYFTRSEPSLPAAWKNFVLDHTLKGSANPLQGQQSIYGSLEPGDLLFLLRDVEKLL